MAFADSGRFFVRIRPTVSELPDIKVPQFSHFFHAYKTPIKSTFMCVAYSLAVTLHNSSGYYAPARKPRNEHTSVIGVLVAKNRSYRANEIDH